MLKIQKSIHPLSGSTTSSSDSFPSLTSFETSDSLLEEFADELAHVDSFPSEKDDDLFDFEDNNDEWRNILYHDPFDDIQSDDNDDLFDLKFDNDEWKKLLYGDSFKDIDSEKDKSKDSKMKLLIDEANIVESNVLPPRLLKSDSTLPEESSESFEIATLLSFPFGNEDNVFNPRILILGGTQIFNDELKDKDFKIVNVHPNILNEGPMKIFQFFCFCPKDKGIRGESSKILAQKQALLGRQPVIPYDREDHRAVLNIKKSNHPFSGSTTSPSDSSPSLTPFETSDSLLEEFADELALLDPFPPGNEDDNFDLEVV
ncbi:hypothetical protein Tco_0324719 [Tanacetum coccineum]